MPTVREQVEPYVDQALQNDEDGLLMVLGTYSNAEDRSDVEQGIEDTFLSFSGAKIAAPYSSGRAGGADRSEEQLKEDGESFFDWLWDEVKAIVCHIHDEGLSVGDDENLTKYIAGAIVAAGKFSGALAALVVVIAVRRGLNNLCETET